jgi:rfaE bifunctional protein nucleotidyltransferase chain/domain
MPDEAHSPFLDEAKAKIIASPEALAARLEESIDKQRVVLVKGVYDLLHIGHFESFCIARAHGEVLVVAVNGDAAVKERKGPLRPIIPEAQRMLVISGLSCVTWVTKYDDPTPYRLISTLRPAVFAASHFDYLTRPQFAELSQDVEFLKIAKTSGTSTSSIIGRIK